MSFPKNTPWVVVHVPDSAEGTASPVGALRAYAEWAVLQGRGVRLLVPERQGEVVRAALGPGSAVEVFGYRRDKGLALPAFRASECVLLVNGAELPRFDVSAVGSLADESKGELTVFGPPSAEATHYHETVNVDESGQVLSFRRFYDDSPNFADHWSGDAALIATTGEHLRTAAAQVVARGWGLESVGALSRRLAVRWTHEPWTLCDAEPALERLHCSEASVLGEAELEGAATGTPRFDTSRWDTGDSPSAERRLADLLAREPALQFEDLQLLTTPKRPAYEFTKRAVDIITSALGLILLAPFLLLVALLVKLTSKGSVFFVHRRQGLGGREFPCLKFRSMRQDAHELQAALRKLNQVDGPQFKIDKDPRETPIGGWLRRLNIDEVPQLFNVLIGHMSLVGPRPSPDSENQMCPAWRRARLSVRPGVTGMWQVLRLRDNPDTDFQEWIYYDVEYAKHRSAWLDALILLNTPIAMFRRHHLWHFVEYLRKRGICTHAGEMGWDAFFAANRKGHAENE